MSFLIDTDVVSALAPTKKDRPPALLQWLEARSNELFLSAVTSAEIRSGIAKARREGAGLKADALTQWWDAVEYLYGQRILPFDLKVAPFAGAMADRARALGLAPGFADIAIAATAEAHGLILLTRNLRHFEKIFPAARDPFANLPD